MLRLVKTALVTATVVPLLLAGCKKSEEPSVAQRLFQATTSRDAVKAATELGKFDGPQVIEDLTSDIENRLAMRCAENPKSADRNASNCFWSADNDANGKVIAADLDSLRTIADRTPYIEEVESIQKTIWGVRASNFSEVATKAANRDYAEIMIKRNTTFAGAALR